MRLLSIIAALTLASPAFGQDKMTLILDWFVNPDHGPIVIAQEKDISPSKIWTSRSSHPLTRLTHRNW